MANKKKNVPTDVRESAHKIWLAGLGALSVAEDEGSKLFKRLVKEGEGFEKRGKDRMQKVQDTVETKVDDVRDAAETTWDRLGSNFDERVRFDSQAPRSAEPPRDPASHQAGRGAHQEGRRSQAQACRQAACDQEGRQRLRLLTGARDDG